MKNYEQRLDNVSKEVNQILNYICKDDRDVEKLNCLQLLYTRVIRLTKELAVNPPKLMLKNELALIRESLNKLEERCL